MTSSDTSQTTVRAWAWQCQECARECVPIRAESRCMCGHRLKEHTDGHRCSNSSCSCPHFSFIVAEGSWILRCRCKHKHTEHDPASHSCKKATCSCTGFYSPWVCNCNHPWSQHQQIMVERQVLRLGDMLAQAHRTVVAADAHTDIPTSSNQAAAELAAAAVAATAALHPGSKPSNSIARLQQPQCLRRQQQQGREETVAAAGLLPSSQCESVPPTATAAAAGSSGVNGAVSREVLLAEGDLTCEVNRWDLLRRGKQ